MQDKNTETKIVKVNFVGEDLFCHLSDDKILYITDINNRIVPILREITLNKIYKLIKINSYGKIC